MTTTYSPSRYIHTEGAGDGLTRIHSVVKDSLTTAADGHTAWLTQSEIVELFQTTKQIVSLHVKNIFAESELHPVATVKDSLTVQTEGNHHLRVRETYRRLPEIRTQPGIEGIKNES